MSNTGARRRITSRDIAAADAGAREHTLAEFDVVRKRAEFGSLSLYSC